MFLHYLKIAWRNLLKYKTQSVISVLGLAIGFTAFSFTLSWIRYERGYDSHIQNGDRIFRVFVKDSTRVGGVSQYSPNAMASYLKENYPEIEAVTGIYPYTTDWNVNNKAFIERCNFIRSDTSFFHVFYPDIKISFPEWRDKDRYILSTSTARKLGLRIQDTGQRIDSLKINLLDIVLDKTSHSNVPFEAIHIPKSNTDYDKAWGYWSDLVYLRVKEGVNIESLKEKLADIEITLASSGEMIQTQKYQCKLVPLAKVRTTHPDTEVAIQYQQLRLFAFVALLVIFCAFFNYLMLFINKIRIRSRALALQEVSGASNLQLVFSLLCEFILLLVGALMVGMILMELLHPSFVKFSMIEASKSFFIGDALLFGLLLLLLSVFFAFLPVRYFMKRTVQENLQPGRWQKKGFKDRFTRLTISFQLVISILLIFSTVVFVYQYSYLNSDYIGFNRHTINVLITHPNELPLDEIKKIAGVEDAIRYGGDFLPKSSSRLITVESGGKRTQFFGIEMYGPEFVEFFDINIIEGRNIHDGETGVYLINQTADRLLTRRDSSGVKKINSTPVVGVIEDMYIDSPVVPVLPSVYELMSEEELEQRGPRTLFYAYKYVEGTRFATEKEMERIGTEVVGNRSVGISNMAELYAEYTKSERYLLILLSVMTGVAILIALFGVYSLITLACNQRRKEIAIRKVNGAKAKEIFLLFFREYFVVTLLSCVVAFPVGVYIMQRWLEQYTRRVSMEWWLFSGIFVLVILIVLGSIYSRVNRAARENPAKVVKSD